MSAVSVLAVVVAYEGTPSLEVCLEALRATRYRSLDVLVVDNASRDGSAAVASRLGFEVVRSSVNRGFAGGVNKGIDHWERVRGGADVYALVNQDCIVDPGWLGPFIAMLTTDPSVSVVGGRLYAMGRAALQHAGARIAVNGLTEHIGRDEIDDTAHRRPCDVDYVTGALLAFSRAAWRNHGPLDEGYFPAYFEEVDFCVRCRAAGRRVVYIPESEAVHGESSVLGAGSRAFLNAYHTARMRFAVKHLLVRGRVLKTLRAELWWLLKRRRLREVLPAIAAYGRVPGLVYERLRGSPGRAE